MMAEPTPGKLDLSRLELQRFAPIATAYSGSPLRELSGRGGDGQFDLDYALASDLTSGSILVFLRLRSSLLDEDTVVARHSLTYRFVFSYALAHIGDVLRRPQPDVVEVTREALGLLLSISYATLRGALPGHYLQTPFRRFHLPIRTVPELLALDTFAHQDLITAFEDGSEAVATAD